MNFKNCKLCGGILLTTLVGSAIYVNNVCDSCHKKMEGDPHTIENNQIVDASRELNSGGGYVLMVSASGTTSTAFINVSDEIKIIENIINKKT